MDNEDIKSMPLEQNAESKQASTESMPFIEEAKQIRDNTIDCAHKQFENVKKLMPSCGSEHYNEENPSSGEYQNPTNDVNNCNETLKKSSEIDDNEKGSDNKQNENMNEDLKEIKEAIYKLSGGLAETEKRIESNLRNEIKLLDKDVKHNEKTLMILFTVLGLLVTVGIFTTKMLGDNVNTQYNAMKESVNANYQLINQRLSDQEKINSSNIEKSVAQEFLKQKK